MRRHRTSFESGVTLIELMVVVGIIAILAAIAYPSYQAFVHQTDRSDATRTMAQYSQMLQRCYSQYFDYTNANCPAPVQNAAVTNSPNGYYSVTVASTQQTYTLTAVPVNAPQTGDKSCVQFTLDQTGLQTAKNSAGTSNAQITQTCWGSN
jgi:type IV pilus assembly protein PilE